MKIPRLAFIFLLGFYGQIVHAQVSNWQWAMGAGNIKGDVASGVCIGINKNVYICGAFSDSSIAFGSSTLTLKGASDANSGISGSNIFIACYNASGNCNWARSLQGEGQAVNMATDKHGNIYITGFFSLIIVGGDTFSNSYGGDNVFIAKYDSVGNLVWLRYATGSSGDNIGNNIAIDTLGYVYITGVFTSSIIAFGADTLSNTSTRGTSDIFLVKYDTAGNELWARSTGGTNHDYAYGICSDGSGNVYTAGNFTSNSMAIGNYTLVNQNDSTSQIGNSFISKYDAMGNVLWAKALSSLLNAGNGIYGLCSDANGHVYAVGNFGGPYMIWANDTLINGGFFIIKFDPAGDLLWAKADGASGSDAVNAIASDKKSGIYVTGIFWSSVSTICNNALTGGDTTTPKIFIAKYDTSGAGLWSLSAGGSGYNNSNYLTTDTDGTIYLSGAYDGSEIDFGHIILHNQGSGGLFIAKLDTSSVNGLTTTQTPISSITVYPNPSTGTFYFAGVALGDAIEVYDILGQEITSPPALSTVEGANSRLIDLSGRPAGVYFYRVTVQGATIAQGKMVVE